PGVIYFGTIEVADLLHPLSAPGARIKERNDAERSLSGRRKCSTDGLPPCEFGLSGLVRIQPEIDPFEQGFLPAIGRTPINEEGPFVFQICGRGGIPNSEISDLPSPLTLLDFPTRQIRVNKDIASMNQGRADSEHEDDLGLLRDSVAEILHFSGVEKILKFDGAEIAEDGIVSA